MLKAALAWRGKSKVCLLPLSCAYCWDSMFKCSGLGARGSPLLTHFCTAAPVHAHTASCLCLGNCLLPREFPERTTRSLCLPDCNASVLREVLPLVLCKCPKTKPNLKCICKKHQNIYNPQMHRHHSGCSGKTSPLFLQPCGCKKLTFSINLLSSSLISGFLCLYFLSPCLLRPSFSQSALSISSTQQQRQ